MSEIQISRRMDLFLRLLEGDAVSPGLFARYAADAEFSEMWIAAPQSKALPTVTLAVSPASVDENGAPNLVYTFTRSGSAATSLTVFYTLAGTAANGTDYVGVPTKGTTKAVVIPVGSLTAQVTVNPTGDVLGESDETVILRLAPATAYVVGTVDPVTGTIANDDPVTTITLAVSAPSVLEDGATNLVYTFTRAGSTAAALSVNYVVSGTAVLGTDYVGVPTKGTTKILTFAAGSGTAQVIVNPTADIALESDETVALTLAAGSGYVVGTTTPVSSVIANDEIVVDVTLSVSAPSVTEDGADNLVYTFTRSGSTAAALNVNYLVSGTAAIGVDYTGAPTSGTTKIITIASGSSSAALTVDPVADATIEPNEIVSLKLAAGAGYLVQTPDPVSAAINDDDAAAVSVALASSTASEDNATDLVYVFTRTGSAAGALTVNYTLGGTASAGVDYLAAPTNSVTFAAGSTTAVALIDPTPDFAIESTETVTLTLASGTGYTIATVGAVQGSIVDDDVGDVFKLQSRPGANLTIYLDFDGASLSGTAWASSATSAPAFDLDANVASFSSAEKAAIREIFYRVAADFAPFNVNVTTEWLGQEKITRASYSDSIYGTVCLFSRRPAASPMWAFSTTQAIIISRRSYFPRSWDRRRASRRRRPMRSAIISACRMTGRARRDIIQAKARLRVGLPSWASATASPSFNGARGNIQTPTTRRTIWRSSARRAPRWRRTITRTHRPTRSTPAR